MINLKKTRLPDSPGVYSFKRGREILYIGKATSLRGRVRSYFSDDILATRGPRLVVMLKQATKIDYQPTDSVLEALILEAALIKKHQPRFNVKERDDKSFYRVAITKETFPRILLVRGHALPSSKLEAKGSKLEASYYGPFPHSGELKEALKIIRKIFPFRDRCRPNQGQPCFDRQLGLCPGVCTGAASPADYRRTIRNIKLLFAGRKPALLKTLEREMRQAAKRQDFELAKRLRNQLFALKHIQDVALIRDERIKHLPVDAFRVEAFDVSHTAGTQTVGVMTVVLNSQTNPSEYRMFKLRGAAATRPDDTANLAEILARRFRHDDWPRPQLVVVDGGRAQMNQAEQALKAADLVSPVVGVVKDERHQPKNIVGDQKIIAAYEAEILLANREADRFAKRYHRRLRRRALR